MDRKRTDLETRYEPALNKEGLAKCTFFNSNSKTGVCGGLVWSSFNLNFEIMCVHRRNFLRASITTDFEYGEDTKLGIVLTKMGLVAPQIETIMTEDEDGFFMLDTPFPLPDIDAFLCSKKGNHFLAKVTRATEENNKGCWEIDIDTLKPFVKA